MLELLECVVGGLIVLVISLFAGAATMVVPFPFFCQTTPRGETVTD